MLLIVLQEVIFVYDCEMSIVIYPVYFLILYLFRSVYCFFFGIIVAGMSLAVLQEVITLYASKRNILSETYGNIG